MLSVRLILKTFFIATLTNGRFQPTGMGENQLKRGVKVVEGIHAGGFFSDPALLRTVVPNEQRVVAGLVSSGALVWDDTRKCVRHKVGAGR